MAKSPDRTVRGISYVIIGIAILIALGSALVFAGSAQTSEYPDKIDNSSESVSTGDTLYVDLTFDDSDPANATALVSVYNDSDVQNATELGNETLNATSDDFGPEINETTKTANFSASDLNISDSSDVWVEIDAANESTVVSWQITTESDSSGGGGGLIPSTDGWPIPIEFILAILGSVTVLGAVALFSRRS